jgi:hypothetical protein
MSLNDVSSTEWEVSTHTSKIELYVNLEQRNGSWVSVFEYNTDLFREETIRRLANDWEALLNSIVAHPDCNLSSLACLSSGDVPNLVKTQGGEIMC